MYWLLDSEQQKIIRDKIDQLVISLSKVKHKPQQSDQVFPFQGRKAINHAKVVINNLTNEGDNVCDPFCGSGSFSYAGAMLNRNVFANEYEPYTYRMSKSPFSLPDEELLSHSFDGFVNKIKDTVDYFYRTKCDCGEVLPLNSLNYDRLPERYINISMHERLGDLGENITFRGRHKCKSCGRTEKFFDDYDQEVLDSLPSIDNDIFNCKLIENSRINLSKKFLTYGSLFPLRSKVVLDFIWKEIQSYPFEHKVKEFVENAFFTILPLAKHKDYRSKSQDLHCPDEKLKETNLLNIFIEQFNKRKRTLYSYELNNYQNIDFENKDFRCFLDSLNDNGIDLVITDPPWNDGNAYFERAQLYHPWLDYSLKDDLERLANEMIVSDSPERPDKNDKEQWWSDMNDFFKHSYRVLKPHSFVVMYFRPVPARNWISNFNQLKLLARINGFEPLLTCDLANNDPSMRIQQSAHYAFSSDLILTFVKLDVDERRIYFDDHDIDEVSFRVAVEVQDSSAGPFTYHSWSKEMHNALVNLGLLKLTLPKYKKIINQTFDRVCEPVESGLFLPKATTPYSDEIFNTPYIERVSLCIPYVIEELLSNSDKFTFDQFLLKVAEFVENGTRAILKDILDDGENSIHELLNLYAEPLEGGHYFTKRPLPAIPSNIASILELDPYEFEVFVAELLELEGYTNVAVSGRAGDRGVDVRCNDANGDLVIVQCKRYTKSNIGSTPIQRLHSFALTRGAKRKICITTTDFTPDGADEARITGVETWNRDALESLVHKHKMFS
ncbi:restriction system protein [Vibrio crassostreae]|nr:restriction system protein [Vibrio crassostreae]CAK2095058.1 restriction system protein [Vibrio crassostreae]CAK2098875.1 restriction system protein [Vibrio crassostreae]CAK2101909.1 restriction system protein [Vibrio crassostreae]CAK2102290.1 restriction system protein [Vibrio crassostreae]